MRSVASTAPAAAAVLMYHAIAFWVPSWAGCARTWRLRPRLLQTGGADDQTLPTDTATLAQEEAHDASTRSEAQADP